MKKPNHIILMVFVLFLCLLTGFFIGRITARNQITSRELSAISRPVSSNEETVSTGDGKININTASSRQLQMLPNIGEVLADRIIAYRTQNGPFPTVDDLVLVDGIGEKRLEELRKYITVGG